MPHITFEDFVVDESMACLWAEKDQAAIDTWAASKRADFEAGGKMKEKHESSEALEEWISKQGASSKKDSLWLRTNPKVFFDITIDGTAAGRVVMQLRRDKVPKTAENFRCVRPCLYKKETHPLIHRRNAFGFVICNKPFVRHKVESFVECHF